MPNEINYEASIKTFAATLNNLYGLSVHNTAEFIKFLSHGKVTLSQGAIHAITKTIGNNLRNWGIHDLLEMLLFDSLWICDDATGVHVNGQNKHIYVSCNEKATLYTYEPKKGLSGIKDRLLDKGYTGFIIHDHDVVYFRIPGVQHQECLVHIDRALKAAQEIHGQELSWPGKMRDHLKLGIHCFDHTGKAGEKRAGNEKEISREDFISEYDDILTLADKEYAALFENDPNNTLKKYHRDDYNLFKRLKEYKKETLNFISNDIPCQNNRAFYRQI